MKKTLGSLRLPRARGGLDEACLIHKGDDTGEPVGGTQRCFGGRYGKKWTKSCFATVAEECELNERPCSQAQQVRATNGGPVCWDLLSVESLHDAFKALTGLLGAISILCGLVRRLCLSWKPLHGR